MTSSSVRQPIHRVRFLDERRAQAASVSVDEQVERMVKDDPARPLRRPSRARSRGGVPPLRGGLVAAGYMDDD